jgi:hypothetical protein
MNTHLSSRQVGFMAFCLLLGTAVTYMPENSAGRDAWICTLLAIPVGVSILALVIGVQKMFPGRNILEVSQLVMGRSLGQILSNKEGISMYPQKQAGKVQKYIPGCCCSSICCTH